MSSHYDSVMRCSEAQCRPLPLQDWIHLASHSCLSPFYVHWWELGNLPLSASLYQLNRLVRQVVSSEKSFWKSLFDCLECSLGLRCPLSHSHYLSYDSLTFTSAFFILFYYYFWTNLTSITGHLGTYCVPLSLALAVCFSFVDYNFIC